jgi:protein TonB
MEAKKSSKADLEIRKNLFLEAGLIISLSLALVAFEWKSPVIKHINLAQDIVRTDMQDVIDITNHEMPRPKAVPPTFTRIELVENELKTDDYDPFDAESSEIEDIPVFIPALTKELKEENSTFNDEIFVTVEEIPDYPGGGEAMRKFLADHLKYPEMAKSANIQGTVFIAFVVEKDGRMSDIKVVRGIGGGCDEESVRVLKMMPKWKPGKQREQPVRVSFGIPIQFRLN